MLILIRIIGIFLILLAVLNLGGLFVMDLGSLISPAAVILRYALMLLAGIGFLLALRWGVIIYFFSVVVNWIGYFTIYAGQGAAGSLWLALPIPLAVGIISALAWRKLKWRI